MSRQELEMPRGTWIAACAIAAALGGVVCTGALAAPVTFFGQDAMGAAPENSLDAARQFRLAISQRGWQTGTQSFDSFDSVPLGTYTSPPLSFGFPPLPGSTTTTVSAASGAVEVADVPGEGRYPISKPGWMELYTNAVFQFSAPVPAVGLYVIDPGDGGRAGDEGDPRNGRLTLVADGETLPFEQHTRGSNGLRVFYGIIFDQPVSRLVLANSSAADRIGVDDMTVAYVPLPPAIGLLGSALVAFLGWRRSPARG